MRQTLLAIIAASIVLVAGFVAYQAVRFNAAAVKWDIPARDVAEEEIEHDGNVMTSRFVTYLDAPRWRVEHLVWDLESLQNTVPVFKTSRLIERQGETLKRMEIGLQPGALPLLTYEMEYKIDRDAHRVTFRSIQSEGQEIAGEYELDASPDGSKTRLEYTTVLRSKAAATVPQSVLDDAARATFTGIARALKRMTQGS